MLLNLEARNNVLDCSYCLDACTDGVKCVDCGVVCHVDCRDEFRGQGRYSAERRCLNRTLCRADNANYVEYHHNPEAGPVESITTETVTVPGIEGVRQSFGPASIVSIDRSNKRKWKVLIQLTSGGLLLWTATNNPNRKGRVGPRKPIYTEGESLVITDITATTIENTEFNGQPVSVVSRVRLS